MKNHWLTILLLLLLISSLIYINKCTGNTSGPDYQAKYDSLEVEYTALDLVKDQALNDHRKEQARADSAARVADEILTEVDKIQANHRVEIRKLKTKNLPYFDSVSLARYGEPLTKITSRGARLLFTDVFNGDTQRLVNDRLSLALDVKEDEITHYKAIVRADSTIIHSQEMQLGIRQEKIDLMIDDHRAQMKREREKTWIYKVAFVGAGLIAVFK